MSKNLKFLFSAFFSVVFPLLAQGQAALRMRMFSMADGLPSNTITMLTTGSNGMLWIGTWNGLCNYDGYRFNSFAASMGAGQILTSNRMRFITPDNNGNVWITTADNHLFLLDSKEQRYVDCKEKLADLGLKGFEVHYMHALDNGAVWIFGLNGKNIRVGNGKHEVVATNSFAVEICNRVLLTADGTEWLIGDRSIRKYGGQTAALPKAVNRIMAAQVIEGNRLAIATDAGLFIYNGKAAKRISEARYDNIYCDARGRLWSTLEDGTAVMMDTKTKVRRLACSVPADWPRLTSEGALVHEDMDGTVWLLLQGKTLCRYDEATESLVPIDLRMVSSSVPTEMKLERIFADRHGNLWFSSLFNLYELSFSNCEFDFVEVMAGEETRSLLADGQGRLVVGTRNGHIVVFGSDGRKEGFLAADGDVSKTPTRFSEKGIYSLYEDSRKRLWVGTRGDGLYVLEKKGDRYRVLRHFRMGEDYNGTQTCGDDYYDIQEDEAGRIWFATYPTGIMYLDEADGERFFSSLNCKTLRLPEGEINKIRRISTANDGILVFSTADGVITISPKFKRLDDIRVFISSYIPNDNHSLLARDVMQTLPCHKSGKTYVATMGGGVQTMMSERLLQNSLQFQNLSTPLLNMGTARGMIEDESGRVWIVCENSLCAISPENNLNSYTSNDWGRPLEFCEAKPVYDKKNKRVILGTIGGMITFSPEEIRQKTFSPSVVFTGIQYQGEERITPLIGNNGITLPTDRHNAVVYFSALDYRDNSQVRYAYRIRELDKQWSYVGHEHCASLSNMPAGHYTLEVRSTNNEGVWLDNQAELSIYVKPTFWQTPWAWLLYLVIGGLAIYFAVYLVWLRKAHRMEKMMKERQLRFFTDISHQLRTPLTLIGGPVTEVLNTEQLSEKANNLLKAVANNASKMLALVNKTLDLNKLQLLNEEVETSSPEHPLSPAISSQPSTPHPFPATPSQVFEDLTILIVEDNAELRYFLRSSLSTYYNIIEAENGKVGLRLAAEHQPDFIITDIMMPEMDGITMLRRIKSDEAICHIPIIIISARTADVYRIEGLKEGADDYITKPFSMPYLQVRVESIVRQRRMLQEEWKRKLLPIGTEMVSTTTNAPVTKQQNASSEKDNSGSGLSSIDQKFVETLTNYINENLHNNNLKIDDIASAMCMSRTVLYGKVKAIYGISPNDVLCNLRMARACTILREDFTMNVTEVAYAVGYSNPRYFARRFKQSIGLTPTEYRNDS